MNSTLPDLTAAEFTYAAAAAGFDFVSLRISKDMNLAAAVRALQETGLNVVDLEFATFTTKTRREHWEWMIHIAQTLGARYINSGCKHPDLGLFTQQLSEFAYAAAEADLQILLEPIKFYSEINYQHMLTLAEQLPATGILLDALQLYRFAVESSSDTAEAVTTRALTMADTVAAATEVFQLCDMAVYHPPAGTDPADFYENEARFDRPLPGTGVIDIAGILKRVPNIPVSVESPNTTLVKKYGAIDYLKQLKKSAELIP